MDRYAIRQRVADMQINTPDRIAQNPQQRPVGNTRENIFVFLPNLIGMADTRIKLLDTEMWC